jgi:hypothetical protein
MTHSLNVSHVSGNPKQLRQNYTGDIFFYAQGLVHQEFIPEGCIENKEERRERLVKRA